MERAEYELLLLKMKEWGNVYFVNNGSRTSERQKDTLMVLLRDPEQDLFQLSAHGTTCPFCAPREGRVYSRSGIHPIFPPLALAFQKIDKDGPDVLWNTYLVTHPNTLHVLSAWTPCGLSEGEIEEIEKFSNISTNPLSKDPRSEKQREAYKAHQCGRKKFIRQYIRLFERCTASGISDFPKTYKTFEKHKVQKTQKYKKWMDEYSRYCQQQNLK